MIREGLVSLFRKYADPSQHSIESFELGATAIRQELREFVHQQLQGVREGMFAAGQDDGLRWVLDHLEFLLDDQV